MAKTMRTSMLGGPSGLYDRIACWFHRRRLVDELGSLNPADRDGILRDIGLSMSDLRAMTRPNTGPATLLPDRLEVAGIAPAALHRGYPAVYRDLERVCAQCQSWRRCARDLARDRPRGQAGGAVGEYCLNSKAIDDLSSAMPR